MTNKPASQWDAKRFVQTLNYFEVIPFLNCVYRLFTAEKPAKTTTQTETMGNILIITNTLESCQSLINELISQSYSLKVLSQNTNLVSGFGDKVQGFLGDLLSPQTLIDEVMKNVEVVIFFPENIAQSGQEISNLANILQKYSASEKTLFDFTNPTADLQEIWGAVDDVVMGGVSESQMVFARNRGLFVGNVSTANNGGFASVRTRNFSPPWDLSEYQGIELKLQGDGKRYKFISRCEGKWDGVGYCYSFDTIYDFPQTLQIPFKDLIPVFRAKTIDAGSFDASKVYSMQLMLSKFEYDGALNPQFSAGSFTLEVESIKAYGGPEKTPRLILVNPSPEIENEIKSTTINYSLVNLNPQESSTAIADLLKTM